MNVPADFAGPSRMPADWQVLAETLGEVYLSAGAAAALEVVDAAVDAAPLDGHLPMLRAKVLLASGQHAAAFDALMAAMALGTDVEVLDLVAEAVFPGPDYRRHLAALHEALRPATYLEIGVFKGETLALARPGTSAIGVDPDPLAEAARSYVAATRVHRVTSDAYFADGAGIPPIDLAFIDGLHLCEQVLRDFINVERHCHAGSLIVLHDTLPVAAEAAARERRTRHWCGDVWKIVPCLQSYRPDLALLTIPTHPSGLTLIARLDPSSHVLAEHYDQAVASLIDAALPPDWLAVTARGDVANDLDEVATWVRQRTEHSSCGKPPPF